MHQAPAWLPYRLRNWIDQWRIDRAVGEIGRTRPRPAAEGGQAAAEVHMLFCRRDLRIGLVALKSLLRFAGGRLGVALSDDGSLTERDRAWVSRHIPGARWLHGVGNDPQIRRLLSGRPRLTRLYDDGDFPLAAKVVHPMALAHSRRIILLDPDTAFFGPPKQILTWLETPEPQLWYMHDHQDEAMVIPAAAEQVLEQMARHLTSPGRTWAVQHRLFNSGLLLFHPEALDLDAAEQFLEWRKGLEASQCRGPLNIWFGPWTPEQTAYHVMFALSSAPVHPLGDDYHLGGAEGHVFNHFLRHYLVQRPTLARLRALVDALD